MARHGTRSRERASRAGHPGVSARNDVGSAYVDVNGPRS